MFDLITGQTRHIPSKPGVSILISMSAQAALLGAILVPVLFFTGALPEVPTMMAFVVEASAPPPPPPPPPPAAKSPAPASAKPAPSPGAAPVEPPSTIQPERPNDEGDIGVPGGVEGGIPGGVPGGFVGGLPGDIPPPPPPAPPPPPPPPRAPVRVGGQIEAPALIRKVDPIYPDVAVSARIRGVVILEANVDRDGYVVDVKVLRTASRLLDGAAITAVRQWQYRPLVLNGSPEPFVLTVVLTFNLVEDS
ncbi:MAG TPA: energy transducer TonB [Vicinamibacterales bacterium]|nr:energy transducer TonB [Vicinamibacterales bacterium]